MEDDSWGVGDDVMFVRGSGWGWLLSCHLPPSLLPSRATH